jgi:hypothetical protein
MITKKQTTHKTIHKSKKQSTKQSKYKNQSKLKKHSIVKHIYIKNDEGFGSKVFDLIFAIYLYNLYNKQNKRCIIHYILDKSIHEKVNDPLLYNIFPKTTLKIKFILLKEYETTTKKHKMTYIERKDKRIESLDNFPHYEELSNYTKIYTNLKLIYKMYKTFTKQDKDSFTMNPKILTDKPTLYKITSQLYSIVHIRYGDKLYYLSKNMNKPDIDITTLLHKEKENKNNPNPIDQFILYTPDYYIDKINELLETTPKHMNIYIITESANIVKQFIMNQSHFNTNPRIILLDKMTWWDSFYLFYYASNIILSASTFCFSGAYFNKKMAKCELLLYHHDYSSPTISPEEYAISPSWKITKDRKYILNYNPKIAYEVIKFKYNWKY